MSWQLAWAEEFTGLVGTPWNPTDWHLQDDQNYETGTLNWYRPQNAYQDGASHGIIEAKPEVYNGYAYTSAQASWDMSPLQLLHQTPAPEWAVEASVQLPTGKGIWPAGPWFLGANWNFNPPPGVAWPPCGEIDHNEWYGIGRNQVRCNVVKADGGWLTKVVTFPFNIDEGLHTYRTEVQGGHVRFLADGVLYHTVSQSQVPNWIGTYDQPFNLLMQIEVGGNGGTPDSTTIWPAKLICDYIRVYQWMPDPTPPPPTGGTSMNAVDTSSRSSEWNVEGTDLYAWGPGWVQYAVTGLADTVTVVARNHGSLPVPVGYSFKLDVVVDSVTKGTLSIPGSQTDQSGSLSVPIPSGTHALRLTWTNDAYKAGQYDANLRLRTIVLATGGTPPPPLPPATDPKVTAKQKLIGLGLTSAEADVVVNP